MDKTATAIVCLLPILLISCGGPKLPADWPLEGFALPRGAVIVGPPPGAAEALEQDASAGRESHMLFFTYRGGWAPLTKHVENAMKRLDFQQMHRAQSPETQPIPADWDPPFRYFLSADQQWELVLYDFTTNKPANAPPDDPDYGVLLLKYEAGEN